MVTLRKPRATMNSGGVARSSTGKDAGKSSGRRTRSSSSPSASSSAPATLCIDRKRTLRSANGGANATKASTTSPSLHTVASTRRHSVRNNDDVEEATQSKRSRRVDMTSADTNANEDEADSEASYSPQDDDGDSDDLHPIVSTKLKVAAKAASSKVVPPKARPSSKAASRIKASTNSAIDAAAASTSSSRLGPSTSTLAASSYYSATNPTLATAREIAQRTQMLSLLAPIAAAPRRELEPGQSYHKGVRQYFANLKNSRVYQLSERPANAPAWRDVVSLRRDSKSIASGGFVRLDALKPSAPLPIRPLDPGLDDDREAIERADTYASVYTREAVSGQRIFALPFAATFEKAPILGVDETNLTVRSSTGETLLQRFSPTSRKHSMAGDKDWREGGKAMFDALFARSPPAKERDGNLGQVIHCGGWSYPGGKYGWSSDHSQRRPESDDALRWIRRWFYAHVITLACYLERDLQEDLAMRESGFKRYKRLMGTSQTALAHPWYTLASVTKGHETTEASHGSDKEPSIMTTFEEPILLYVAHSESFFKTVVRPGQVVFLRSHKLHSIQPLTHPRIDKPRYGVSLPPTRQSLVSRLAARRAASVSRTLRSPRRGTRRRG